MIRKHIFIYLSLTALLIFKVTISYANINKPLKLRVISVVSQKNIDAQVIKKEGGDIAGYIIAGIPGAIIAGKINQNHMEKKAIAALNKAKPYREMLKGFDFAKEIQETLYNSLQDSDNIELISYTPSNKWNDINTKPVKITNRNKDYGIKPGQVKVYNNEKLLVLNTTYSLDPDLNIIHVETSGQLYLGKIKNSKKLYKSKLFRVIYQSPANEIKYAKLDEQLFQKEKNRSKIKKEISKEQIYRRPKSRATKELRIGMYAKLTNPIKINSWTRENMRNYLLQGLQKTSNTLIDAVSNTSRHYKTKENRIKIPILLSAKQNQHPRLKKAFIVSKDTTYDTVYFKFEEVNIYYHIPKGQTIVYPNYLAESQALYGISHF